MSDIYIDGSGDIVFQAGDLVFTSDYGYSETVKSRLVSYLRTFLGEWFLDNKLAPIWGVPYWQNIFVDRIPSVFELDSIFRAAILSIEGITRLDLLYFELDKRVLTVTFEAVCEDGSRIEDVLEIGIGGL
jgi:hypothetical protein